MSRMPRLEWIGKAQVVNHAREVPFHVLERKYSYGDNSSNNKIIHGDNLLSRPICLLRHICIASAVNSQ